MKKLFLSLLSLVMSMTMFAQSNVRKMNLIYDGQVVYSRAVSLIDSIKFVWSDGSGGGDDITGGTQTFTVNGVSFTMVGVEGGTFIMGATSEQGTSDPWDDEYPTHSVTLSDFAIGETEVTQELWQAVMGSNPSSFSGTNLPVEEVSWNDCQTFITKLNQLTGKNFRLPTEAEWEYAARGGNKSKGYKYAGSNTLSDVAWYGDNSSSKTHPVQQKQANELGLYDMSGNVYEWCQDWFGGYSSSAQTNPTGPVSGSSRVNRGGSWTYSARFCRVSFRFNNTPTNFNSGLGLRLAL
ncbi:MAG: SUMF1/EgtB/PvdO family nonheme iron enzyme [Paludibacteraceae bacterium]|nr:SUMF1/EgtB/PvdO family nonheme iron enzyme [Paludibacteraceae bacterium]